MPLQLPNSKRALIEKAGNSMFIAVAAASVVVAFCIVAINFMWDKAQYNSRVQTEKELARDTLITNIANATSLKTSFNQLETGDDLISGQGKKSNSAVILDALPRKYDFPALRTSIEKLADLSGVKLASFNGNDQESEAIASMISPVPQEIVFSVAIECNYDSLIDFIDNLENTIRPIKIERLRVSGSDSLMNASLDLITYYQPSVDINIQTRNIE